MSRVTQLSRTVSSAASRASPLLDSTAHHAAGVSIMPKYADLLMRGARSSEQHLHDRSITTTHRPTPQPSIANRSRPLMQTFSSSASSKQSAATLDATVIPSSSALYGSSANTVDQIRVPLLPDAFSIAHPEPSAASSYPSPEVNTIVASDPDNVIPGSGLAEVSHAGGADAVDLGFAHQPQEVRDESEGGMLKDLWKGMMDDIFNPAPATKKA